MWPLWPYSIVELALVASSTYHYLVPHSQALELNFLAQFTEEENRPQASCVLSGSPPNGKKKWNTLNYTEAGEILQILRYLPCS